MPTKRHIRQSKKIPTKRDTDTERKHSERERKGQQVLEALVRKSEKFKQRQCLNVIQIK